MSAISLRVGNRSADTRTGMPSAADKKDSPRDRRRKAKDEDDAVAAAAPVVREPMPKWIRYSLAFVSIVCLLLAVAFSGAWMGVRSIEAEINYGPDLEPEDDESEGLPALTLGRGLDIAMERPLERGGAFSTRMPSDVRWTPGGLATSSASWEVLAPDEEREVEIPLVPKNPDDARLIGDPRLVSAPAEREGGLNRSERLVTPSAVAGQSGRGEPMPRDPGTPPARLPDPSPQAADPVSTLAPPYVYNEAVGVSGRSYPIPFAAEYALPAVTPPDDDAPLEAGQAPVLRSRERMP